MFYVTRLCAAAGISRYRLINVAPKLVTLLLPIPKIIECRPEWRDWSLFVALIPYFSMVGCDYKNDDDKQWMKQTKLSINGLRVLTFLACLDSICLTSHLPNHSTSCIVSDVQSLHLKFSNFGHISKWRKTKFSPFSWDWHTYAAASLLTEAACRGMAIQLEMIGRMTDFSLKLSFS